VVPDERAEPSPRPSGPRATDAERDWFAKLLQRHFAEGSLTGEEFAERLSRVFAARTLAELYAIVSDLPHLPVVEVPRAHETRRSRLRWWRNRRA
jgi:hypothetical protein